MSIECEKNDCDRRDGLNEIQDSVSDRDVEQEHIHAEKENFGERDEKRQKRRLDREAQVKRQWRVIATVAVVCIGTFAVWAVSLGMKARKTGMKKSFRIGTEQVQETVKKEIHENGGTEDTRETLEQKLERVRTYAEAQGYPEEVIELLSKNPETVQFVENYGEKRDSAPADTLGSITPGEIPLILQWDERWGYSPYGDSMIAVSGCGPTCMSMVISGLTNDPTVTPVVLADYGTANHYLDDDNNTYWQFMREAGERWGVSCDETFLDEEALAAELNKGRPVICSMSRGYFTQMGHFMVITGYKDGSVKVNDPFSIENSSKWWRFSDIKDQIQGMWVYYTG